jgi:outer membrane protein OmpA-like peptidoglycan-associated protein
VNCAPEGWIATSLSNNYYFINAPIKNTAKAHSGTHYIGVIAGSLGMMGIRNFVRARLLCGLREGHQYKLEMFVYSRNAILDSLGVYFSEQDFLFEKRFFIHIKPQLWSVDGMDRKYKDEFGWKRVELIYTANGTEGYITLGNFKRVDYEKMQPDYKGIYNIFIDDVSLKPVDTTEKLCLEADSVKAVIYAESERHNYLERKVRYGRNNPPPATPLPKTAKKIIKIRHVDTLIIPDIFFASGSAELNPGSFNLLDSFANKLATSFIDSMIVEGHTDSIGKLDYNEALSLNRATSVKNYLTGKVAGLEEKTITRGFAYLRPVASNKTPKGRQLNRRVEIILYRYEE